MLDTLKCCPETHAKLMRYFQLKQTLQTERTAQQSKFLTDAELEGIEDVLIFQAGFLDRDEFLNAMDWYRQNE